MRVNAMLAGVLSLTAVLLGVVAWQAPEVFDPVRARLGTLRRPDAGVAVAVKVDAGAPVTVDAGVVEVPAPVVAPAPTPEPAKAVKKKKRR